MSINQNDVQKIREQYPPGTRICLDYMYDPYAPISSGTLGTVKQVDDAGQIHMRWDNGRSLAVVPGVDSFTAISTPEIEKTPWLDGMNLG